MPETLPEAPAVVVTDEEIADAQAKIAQGGVAHLHGRTASTIDELHLIVRYAEQTHYSELEADRRLAESKGNPFATLLPGQAPAPAIDQEALAALIAAKVNEVLGPVLQRIDESIDRLGGLISDLRAENAGLVAQNAALLTENGELHTQIEALTAPKPVEDAPAATEAEKPASDKPAK